MSNMAEYIKVFDDYGAKRNSVFVSIQHDMLEILGIP